MVSLAKLPDEILYNILSQDCLSEHVITNLLQFPKLGNIAKRVIRYKTEVNLYFLPNYRDINQGCSTHSSYLPPHDKPWRLQVPFHDTSAFIDWRVNLWDFSTFHLYICISYFTIHKLDTLLFLKQLTQKNITLHVYFVLPYTNTILHQLLEHIKVADNKVKLILYLQYSPDICLSTDYLTNIDIVLCSRSHDTHSPFHVTIGPALQRLDILNHFVGRSPPIEFNVNSPNNITTLRFTGLPENTRTFLNCLKRFSNLEYLYLENVPIHKLSNVSQGLVKLKKLDLINTPISAVLDMNLAIAFPQLQHFHIESGSSDVQLNLENIKFANSLQSLKVSRKSISVFRNIAISQGNILKLDLSFNNLQDLVLDDSFSEQINQVNVSYNRMLVKSIPLYRNISLSTYLFTKITQLYLDGCNITNEALERICDLHDGEEKLVSRLEVLSLAENELLNLRCFNSSLFKRLPLRKLDLSFNKFTYINQDNFPISKKTFPDLGYLDFTGNCSLKAIYDIVLDFDYLHVKFVNTGIHQAENSVFPGKHNSIVYSMFN